MIICCFFFIKLLKYFPVISFIDFFCLKKVFLFNHCLVVYHDDIL